MKLSSIILKIAERMDGQRSLNACLHILRGKRSGQTLQDADAFSVKPYFGILPKLSDKAFAESAAILQSSRMLTETDGIICLTQEGLTAVRELPDPKFDGWHYRGREMLFFLRLQLLVQTCSQLRNHEPAFLPIVNDRAIQQFVKQLLREERQTAGELADRLAEELILSVRSSGMTELQAVVFSHRLTGADAAGWTWEQIGETAGEDRNSLQLGFLESVHRIAAAVEFPPAAYPTPLLHKLTAGIRIETPLTDSTSITKKLFDQGLSIAEIAAARRLKTSTIEDHITEIAANTPAFPLDRFVSEEDQRLVRVEMSSGNVKRLRLLKDAFPCLSYFQLRLILNTKERVSAP